jgi:hypothetical protein
MNTIYLSPYSTEVKETGSKYYHPTYRQTKYGCIYTEMSLEATSFKLFAVLQCAECLN